MNFSQDCLEFWIFSYHFIIDWKKKYLWNIPVEEQRHDLILSFNRVYMRDSQSYNYNIIIGKLIIMWTNDDESF